MKLALVLIGLLAAAPAVVALGNGGGSTLGGIPGWGNPHPSAAPSPAMDIGLAALAMLGGAALLARRKSR